MNSILEKINNKINTINKLFLIKKYNGKLKFDISKSIIISGVPRWGTTWFAELLTKNFNTALIWEPIHPDYYPPLTIHNLKIRPYFDKNYHDEKLYNSFKELLQGEVLTQGILQKTNINELLVANFLTVKFCRANRMLPWLTQNFEFHKVIHLLRHPCAVVSSQLKFGAWNDVPPHFTEDELKPDGYIENYYDIIKPIQTIEEKLAAIWCLDNIIPLNYNSENKWVSITYENLLLNPEQTFKNINIKFSDSIKNSLSKASSTTKKGSPVSSGTNKIKQLSYWQSTLTDTQIKSILNILKKFDLSIYNESIYPTVNY